MPARAAIAGRHRDRQRDREAERVRARDDEHRDGALDRVVEVAERVHTMNVIAPAAGAT